MKALFGARPLEGSPDSLLGLLRGGPHAPLLCLGLEVGRERPRDLLGNRRRRRWGSRRWGSRRRGSRLGRSGCTRGVLGTQGRNDALNRVKIVDPHLGVAGVDPGGHQHHVAPPPARPRLKGPSSRRERRPEQLPEVPFVGARGAALGDRGKHFFDRGGKHGGGVGWRRQTGCPNTADKPAAATILAHPRRRCRRCRRGRGRHGRLRSHLQGQRVWLHPDHGRVRPTRHGL
mmetsp:Transcript_25687/g.57609  ORF Transcript_25687/g.57609 Transcript_25687/m.57609 type:complete len:231 (+) Transcript_25687:784-1476(+)